MKQLKSVLVLVCICAVMSTALAVTNYYTAPIIASNMAGKADEALLEVYPGGGLFTPVDISDKNLPATIIEVNAASNGGYVFQLKTNGYAPDMVIMLGVDGNGVITGAKYLSGNETVGLGDVAAQTYSEAIKGSNLDSIDAVAQPTAQKTIQPYLAAVKDALKAIDALSGGEVDFRTPEEIFQDNLEAALPSAEGVFERVFVMEVLTGVDKIYKAQNDTGYVVVMGEVFVGLDANGAVVSDCTAEDGQAAVNALTTIQSTGDLIPVDLTQFDNIPKFIKSVSKTASGNYVLVVMGEGYGIYASYKPNKVKIEIQISMTPDGQIINCQTLSHKESQGYGAACEEEKFYSQFDGKTIEDFNDAVRNPVIGSGSHVTPNIAAEKEYVSDIDAIAGATVTSAGYKEAIMAAFTCVEIIVEGGNQE